MKKLNKRAFSLRESTFALAVKGCACNCDDEPCDCPIAPTHQIGLNAQSAENTKLHRLGSAVAIASAS